MAKKNSEKDNKLKALQTTLDRLKKTYRKGSVMRLGDKPIEKVDAISSGSIALDVCLGTNGFPKGRIVEIYGPESSGKTTIAIHAIAECQKAGGIAAFIDAEHAFDRYYAESLGVDVDELIFSQPDFGEQALEIAENLIRSGAIDILVVDSVAALVPRSEIEGEMGDSKMGLQARLMSQAMRKLTSAIGKANCCCVFINQLREKIGVMFGNPETTTGGNALKFYASQRLDIRRSGGALKNREGAVIGNHVKVKIVKNKLAPPFRIAEFDIMYGEGISKSGEIIDLGVEFDIVGKSGAWYSYGESKIAQGREAAKQFMLDNPGVADEVEAKIRAQLTGQDDVVEAEAIEAVDASKE
jgi:recombination protein RecA